MLEEDYQKLLEENFTICYCETCNVWFLNISMSDFIKKSRSSWRQSKPWMKPSEIPIDRWMAEVVKHHLENKEHRIIWRRPHLEDIDFGDYWRKRLSGGFDKKKMDMMIHEGDDAEI